MKKNITAIEAEEIIQWVKSHYKQASRRSARLIASYRKKRQRLKATTAQRKREEEEKLRAKREKTKTKATKWIQEFGLQKIGEEIKENNERRVKLKEIFVKVKERTHQSGKVPAKVSKFLNLDLDKKLKCIKEQKEKYYEMLQDADYYGAPAPFSILHEELIGFFEIICPGVSKFYKAKYLI